MTVHIDTENSMLDCYGQYRRDVYDINGNLDIGASAMASQLAMDRAEEKLEEQTMKKQHEDAVDELSHDFND